MKFAVYVEGKAEMLFVYWFRGQVPEPSIYK